MLGAIRRRDIIAHPVATIQCFGWKVLARALAAGGNQTFLTLISESAFLTDTDDAGPEVVTECAGLELRVKLLYDVLAERFSEVGPARSFFTTLSGQEEGHSELLELCGAAAAREGWHEKRFEPWRRAVPEVTQSLTGFESRLDGVESLSEAYRFTIEVESSELNSVYQGIVSASDSEFVRKLSVFRRASWDHVTFICDRISAREPALTDACQELRRNHSRPPE